MFDHVKSAMQILLDRIKFDAETRQNFASTLLSGLKHDIELNLLLEQMVETPPNDDFRVIAETALINYREHGVITGEVDQYTLKRVFTPREYVILEVASSANVLKEGLQALIAQNQEQNSAFLDIFSSSISLLSANALFIIFAMYMAVSGIGEESPVFRDASLLKIGEVLIIVYPLIFILVGIATGGYFWLRRSAHPWREYIHSLFGLYDNQSRLRLLRQLRLLFAVQGNFKEAIQRLLQIEPSVLGRSWIEQCLSDLSEGYPIARSMRNNLLPVRHANLFAIQSINESRKTLQGGLDTAIDGLLHDIKQQVTQRKRTLFTINFIIFLFLLIPLVNFIIPGFQLHTPTSP